MDETADAPDAPARYLPSWLDTVLIWLTLAVLAAVVVVPALMFSLSQQHS